MTPKAGRYGVLIPLPTSEGEVPMLGEGEWGFNRFMVVLEAFGTVFLISRPFLSGSGSVEVLCFTIYLLKKEFYLQCLLGFFLWPTKHLDFVINIQYFILR